MLKWSVTSGKKVIVMMWTLRENPLWSGRKKRKYCGTSTLPMRFPGRKSQFAETKQTAQIIYTSVIACVIISLEKRI